MSVISLSFLAPNHKFIEFLLSIYDIRTELAQRRGPKFHAIVRNSFDLIYDQREASVIK